MTSFTGKAEYRDPDSKGRFPRYKSVSMEIPIREVPAADAPLAALVSSSRDFRAPNGFNYAGLRFTDGLLYQLQVSVQGTPVSPDETDRLKTTYGTHATKAGAAATLEAAKTRYLSIDGHLWAQIPEPFILNGPYGDRIDVHPGPPPRSNAWRCFALGEVSAAEAAARGMANRHDRPAPAAPEVTILIPEAFTYPTSAERIAAAQREAETQARQAVDLLENVTPATMQESYMLLMKASSELADMVGPE